MGLGGFIKAATGLFSKRDNGVTLTQEQAELVKGLVAKEMEQISRQRHDIVDKAALKGETIPIISICVIRDGTSLEERAYIEHNMQELIEKYGESMPVNTALRLSREWADEEKVWSDDPGCYERQLQRRDGSPLFPVERRVVTIQEILDAQKKDSALLLQFKEKFTSFYNECMCEMKRNNSLDSASSLLQETMSMLEEATAIGGNLERESGALEVLEESLIKSMNKAMPDGAEILEKAHSLSSMKRVPFFAQSVGKYKAISEDEVVPSLIAEDLETIETMGILSRAFGPDFKPGDADIRAALDEAVERGFSRQRAGKVLTAWAGYT